MGIETRETANDFEVNHSSSFVSFRELEKLENLETIIIDIPKGYVKIVMDEDIEIPSLEIVTGSDEQDTQEIREIQADLQNRMITQTKKTLTIVDPLDYSPDEKDQKPYSVVLNLPAYERYLRFVVVMKEGDIDTSQTHGSLEIVTENAAINIKRHDGDIKINQQGEGTGKIRTEKTNGLLRINNNNEEIKIYKHYGDILIRQREEGNNILSIQGARDNVNIENRKQPIYIEDFQGDLVKIDQYENQDNEGGNRVIINRSTANFDINNARDLTISDTYFLEESIIGHSDRTRTKIKILDPRNDRLKVEVLNKDMSKVSTSNFKKKHIMGKKRRVYTTGKNVDSKYTAVITMDIGGADVYLEG